MINEKPNNNINWKNKLEELEGSAGDVFDKEASWEKLYSRLHSKPNNKKIIWYWAAAACLFFALFISFFFSNKKENVLVKNNLMQKKSNSSPRHVPMIYKETPPVISSLPSGNKKPVHSIKEIITLINYKTLPTEIVQNKKEEIIIPDINNKAVMPVNAAISVVANLPEKKKLKVIHINELGDPVPESPNVARYAEHHSFEIKLLNQEVYTSPSNTSGYTGFNIFKIKNAPSN